MKILTVVTYYRPYTSGLTIYAERLSKALVKRGHDVTVLTMQHDSSLLKNEIVEGLKIERAAVLFRVSKGVISPDFWRLAAKHARTSDVIHLHLPQFDAAIVAFWGRFFKKAVVITYHCDLLLPKSFFNLVVNAVVTKICSFASKCADSIVTYTEDYARTSPYAQKFKNKIKIIPPPVYLPEADSQEILDFAADRLPRTRPLIGMAARLAAEKGVEVLIEALPLVKKKYPEVAVVFAGQYENVLGEHDYYCRLKPKLEALQQSATWYFLGTLDPAEMACFFANLDVLVVPSLNSTESFGMVQIEAMINSVPVVASNLPGVRQPVLMTGMGLIAEIGDANSLAKQILEVLDQRQSFIKDPRSVRDNFSPEKNALAYEQLYQEIISKKSSSSDFRL